VPNEKRQRQKAARQARLAAEQKTRKRRQSLRRVVILVIVAAVVVGVSLLIFRPGKKQSSAPTTTTTTSPTAAAQLAVDNTSKAAGCPPTPTAPLPTPTWKSPPPTTVDPSKTYTATIKTDAGTITANLDAKTAPTAVNDFLFLVNQKYYNCVTFHRVIPQFMDQTGDPTGTGTGSVGYTVQGEVPATANPQYPIGSLAMAKTSAAPNGTSSNQFFIVAGSQGESLPPQYALFGQVTSGQNVVDAINADGDATNNGTPPKVVHRMLSVTVSES
jgi:cyclophilin family peptidyl-prolyl cis-trans isomerase